MKFGANICVSGLCVLMILVTFPLVPSRGAFASELNILTAVGWVAMESAAY